MLKRNLKQENINEEIIATTAALILLAGGGYILTKAPGMLSGILDGIIDKLFGFFSKRNKNTYKLALDSIKKGNTNNINDITNIMNKDKKIKSLVKEYIKLINDGKDVKPIILKMKTYIDSSLSNFQIKKLIQNLQGV